MKSLIVLALSLVLAACGNGSDAPPPLATGGNGSVTIGVIHASPDAPNVDVTVGGATFTSDLAFRQARFSAETAGTKTIEVIGRVPGDDVTVIGPVDIDTVDGERLTIIASNTVANIAPIVIQEPQAEVAAGDVRVRVVHGAPAAPMVDVYVTAPGVDITTVAALGSFSFGEELMPVTVPAGDYQIQVTVAGDATSVVYDSGTVPLAGGSDLIVVAIENTGTGTAPVSLLVADGLAATEILTADTPATVRVVHASPDAPDVDVIAADNFAAPVIEDLAYTQVSDSLSIPAGDLNVKVVPAGAQTPVVIDADLTLVAGTPYSVYAAGALADIEPLVLVDDPRRIATEARLRIVHASPSAGPVDIYLVEPGADIGADDVTPALTNVPFLADSGYLSVAAGDYEVVVTPTGSTTAAIGPAAIILAAGGIYTVAARDEAGLGTPLGLILLDDF